MLNTGDTAPDFTLPDQDGNPVTLSSVLAQGPVVLFFYPAALTPGCTKEACHFRDIVGEFTAAGARVLGISADDVAKQKQFDTTHNLGYPLLSDTDKSVAKAYGVSRRIGLLPNQRATFAIGADGTVVAAVRSEINMNVHADTALKALAAG
ncbi:redoxin domain-containing protein [Gordonia pseudamarae]|uniref:thioredoxin-dependent peroxiredoxin n=1 Tax=Gordonia pseudamarae TaxID=2831662 RepID=A0ABX6IF64_9ACTN|nr:redoxin domain-containing protein [Gordonia pseudamarae]QHN34448.1 redoxin domain-containing protein [Gordonia pseudamarae]